jgi:Cdc6-like AAA superfamily ATPase
LTQALFQAVVAVVVSTPITNHLYGKEFTMTKDEMIDLIWTLEVKHPRMKEILEGIDDCHQSYFRKGGKVNMFITGETGLGKTTICNNYLESFPRDRDQNGAIIPVLYTSMPGSPTPKGLTTQMLDDINCPLSYMGVLIKQKIRLKELARDCRIQLVILDELQHVIDPDSEDILKAVSNLLKELINILQIPIIMVGLPESLAVLTSNRQLGRRVSQHEELTEFRWQDDVQQKIFRSLLKTIDGKLPLNRSSKLATPELAKRIHYASDGVMDHFMKLIRHAAEIAVKKDMDCIDMPLFSFVYDKHVSKLFPTKFNPFAKKNLNRQLKVSRKQAKATGQKPASKRKNSRRKNETPREVLKQ